MITFSQFSKQWLPQIESEMRDILSHEPPALRGMYGMMRYHMGWEDKHGAPVAAHGGKRIRPLLALMTCAAAGGDPAIALPAAAGIELLHNFSLLHDDIEDRSDTRRRRPTVWSWAGEAQAINTGDAMFALAHLAVLRLGRGPTPAPRIIDALHIFDETCLRLTQGQYLDISFEQRAHVSLEEYMMMISGKTAALIAASASLGAHIAGSPQVAAYRRFGHELGLSFQIEDDILGVWGEEAITGKSADGDIITRKKTLPVLYALAQPGPQGDALRAFYARPAPLQQEEVATVRGLLDALQARAYAAEQAQRHAQAALTALTEANGQPAYIELLASLVQLLSQRQS